MEANAQLAGDLLGEMVMEQAIKDKTAMVEAQMRAEAEGVDFSIDGPDKGAAAEDDDEEEDPDFAMDAEEEKMMREMAEQRLAAARADY